MSQPETATDSAAVISNALPEQQAHEAADTAVTTFIVNGHPVRKLRVETDWKAEFRSEEMVDKGEAGRCVRLRGLQRCANLCGIIESYPEIQYIERNGRPGIMQCVYHVRFADGTHFAGAADVNEQNVDAKFAAYPTSVAESRAEARALRKALNITDMLAAEEVGSQEGGSTGQTDPGLTGKIEPQQIAAINAIVEQLKVPLAGVLGEALPAARAKNVFALEDLTSAEGVSILRNLNEKRASLDTQPPTAGGSKKISIDKKESK
jgi:hypothetical protein